MSLNGELLESITAAHLAPDERRARLFDPRVLDVQLVTSPDGAAFDLAYAQLWREFGEKHEMERRDVIAARMARDPARPLVTRAGPAHLLYQMILARDATGAFAAVRDHTAIVLRDDKQPAVTVHLSHLLVAPAHRGSGLAGWMRAWPIATARACAEVATGSGEAATTLVAEMEHADPIDAGRTARLIAYEKAGFRKIDPAAIDYLQPDFRDAGAIDADTVRPLPMSLVVRRVGRDAEETVSGAEVRRIVTALYAMYGADFRETDMAPLYDRLSSLPAEDAKIALVPPTAQR
jgi:GNAT superfamily N-acetyltransferase